MRRILVGASLLAALIARAADMPGTIAPAPAISTADLQFFETKIRPVLTEQCYQCHSHQADRIKGKLMLDSRDAVLLGGVTGPALVPGKPDDSLLIQAIRYTDEDLMMPPKDHGGKLNEQQIADLTEWVRRGAPDPRVPVMAASGKSYGGVGKAHWAFQPVKQPAVPVVKDNAWTQSPLDNFVLAKLESVGLHPNPLADKRTLIRRVTFDLTGLPPTEPEIQRFIADGSPDAYAKVVDRLLDSPAYGERWARYWLDVSRYADDRLDSDVELPYPNSFRYRDWVIKAFNDDMPYDTFVKAQIAGDQIAADDPQLAVGLGFYGLSPELTDDRVDVTTRGFLALTAACAQCHNHKFDPLPTKDFYALQGVFSSTKRAELELAPADEVKRWKDQNAKVEAVKTRIEQFLKEQADSLAEMLASESPRYIRAARKVLAPQPLADVAAADRLDPEVLKRWVTYLKTGPEDNKLLRGWRDEAFDLSHFRQEALSVLKERKEVDRKNLTLQATNDPENKAVPAALPPDRYYLWRDLFFNDFYGREFKQEEDGILWFGPNRGYLTSDGTVERFLEGRWKNYLGDMRAELSDLTSALPPQYAFAHVIKDSAPHDERVQIGGQPDRLGEVAPRAFLSILSAGDPKPFKDGSGRLELAEAIASPTNPLTARVMVNRIWQHHFGDGLVRTVSNFGRMGETPSNPALLDYLAASFVENGWSIKKLQREIMLSTAYQLSSDYSAANFAVDPDNRLLWRANRQRLDAESMRDTLLAVTGELDTNAGGAPVSLEKEDNHRRSVYGFISRRKLDGTLALFDFPNPNLSAEKRISTATPLQQLFFLNSAFLESRAKALTQSINAVPSSDERIRKAYRTVFGRDPRPDELKLGEQFLSSKKDALLPYAEVLLSSNELLFVN